MSHYYCSEHTDNADSRCITCEAAREWVEKDSTISTLQARIEKCEAMLWVAYRKSGSPKEYRDWRNLIKANI